MSAFVVDHELIDVLLTYGAAQRVVFTFPPHDVTGAPCQICPQNATQIGRVLLLANAVNVAELYRQTVDSDYVRAYVYKPAGLPAAPDALRAAACLDYQCCDSATWGGSLARAVVESVRRAAILSLEPGRLLEALEASHPAFARKSTFQESAGKMVATSTRSGQPAITPEATAGVVSDILGAAIAATAEARPADVRAPGNVVSMRPAAPAPAAPARNGLLRHDAPAAPAPAVPRAPASPAKVAAAIQAQRGIMAGVGVPRAPAAPKALNGSALLSASIAATGQHEAVADLGDPANLAAAVRNLAAAAAAEAPQAPAPVAAAPAAPIAPRAPATPRRASAAPSSRQAPARPAGAPSQSASIDW